MWHGRRVARIRTLGVQSPVYLYRLFGTFCVADIWYNRLETHGIENAKGLSVTPCQESVVHRLRVVDL